MQLSVTDWLFRRAFRVQLEDQWGSSWVQFARICIVVNKGLQVLLKYHFMVTSQAYIKANLRQIFRREDDEFLKAFVMYPEADSFTLRDGFSSNFCSGFVTIAHNSSSGFRLQLLSEVSCFWIIFYLLMLQFLMLQCIFSFLNVSRTSRSQVFSSVSSRF